MRKKYKKYITQDNQIIANINRYNKHTNLGICKEKYSMYIASCHFTQNVFEILSPFIGSIALRYLNLMQIIIKLETLSILRLDSTKILKYINQFSNI